MTTMSGVSALSAADIIAARKVKIDRSNEVQVFKQQAQEVQQAAPVESKKINVVRIDGPDAPLYNGKPVVFSEEVLAHIEIARKLFGAKPPEAT